MKNIIKLSSIVVLTSIVASASAYTVVNNIQKPSQLSGNIVLRTVLSDHSSKQTEVPFGQQSPVNVDTNNQIADLGSIFAATSNGKKIQINPNQKDRCIVNGQSLQPADQLIISGEFVGNPTMNANVVAIRKLKCVHNRTQN